MNRKLTEQQRQEIRQLYRLGMRPADIAPRYSVTDSTVGLICRDLARPSATTLVEILLSVLPYLPHEGPPLPRCLGITWEKDEYSRHGGGGLNQGRSVAGGER